MVTKENKRSRGRPREFALEAAIATGQNVFHEHGYENVSVAALTEAIGITPPSFYAAFASKAAFFKETLRLYSATVVPLDKYLIAGASPPRALDDLLRAAARAYAAHPQRRGCLILEHAKSGNSDWSMAAARVAAENREKVRAFLVQADSDAPDRIADYIAASLLGLSAAAREGWGETRLLAVVETASRALSCRM